MTEKSGFSFNWSAIQFPKKLGYPSFSESDCSSHTKTLIFSFFIGFDKTALGNNSPEIAERVVVFKN